MSHEKRVEQLAMQEWMRTFDDRVQRVVHTCPPVGRAKQMEQAHEDAMRTCLGRAGNAVYFLQKIKR